mgnify:CR=1 FL=1
MTEAEGIKAAIAVLSARLAVIEGKPVSTYMGQLLASAEEAEKVRLLEIAERQKPHDWVDLAPGTPPWMVGDNTAEHPTLRSHSTFIDALSRADSTYRMPNGDRFSVQQLKKAGGNGPDGWGLYERALRDAWNSDWGWAWRTNYENLRAGIVPKTSP